MQPRAYAHLDRLTAEQLRQFKRDAARPAPVAPRGAPAPALVALGDSWFDYPLGADIIDCLRAHHGHPIRNRSQAGDTIENMVYGSRFDPLRGYAPLPPRTPAVIDDLQRSGARILLVSGGGNDIAGAEFAQFLEHADAGLGTFRRAHARHVIDVVFRRAYTDLAARAAAAVPGTQLITHGYGYPPPDGRGIGLAIGLSFIGPWLRPALAAKRIPVDPDGIAIIRELIDTFNDMLMSLDVELDNFHYVDLRRLIRDAGPSAWANELHVRNSVYALIADAFHARIAELSPLIRPAAARRAPVSGRARPGSPARSRRRRSR